MVGMSERITEQPRAVRREEWASLCLRSKSWLLSKSGSRLFFRSWRPYRGAKFGHLCACDQGGHSGSCARRNCLAFVPKCHVCHTKTVFAASRGAQFRCSWTAGAERGICEAKSACYRAACGHVCSSETEEIMEECT